VDLVGDLRKPPHELLLIHDERHGYRILLCGRADAHFLRQHLQGNMWLIRPNGRPILETPFDPLAIPEVREMLMQIQFYSGNLYLLNQRPFIDEFKSWIARHPKSQDLRDFFEKEVHAPGYTGSRIQLLLSQGVVTPSG